MKKLFETTNIKGMELANRFVRSATWEGMASEEGASTPALQKTMEELAEGGVGMIITGHTFIRPEGRAGPWQLGIYKDELMPGLMGMAEGVHRRGGRIVLQMAHAGLFARYNLTALIRVGPSELEGYGEGPLKAMTEEQIQATVDSFADAARRAREAGFDGVQIHAAHGYLLSQFLSPAFNKRNDKYGGTVENRARFLLQVLKGVRDEVGHDFPILVKMNSQDFIENGLTLEDSVQAGVLLEENGIDGIEISGGTVLSGKLIPSRIGINKEEKEAYFREAAKGFKDKIGVPIILVGGIRSYAVAEELLSEGAADYISMCRPLIREPDLIGRWNAGDTSRAKCISDNQCFGPAMQGNGIYCVAEKGETE